MSELERLEDETNVEDPVDSRGRARTTPRRHRLIPTAGPATAGADGRPQRASTGAEEAPARIARRPRPQEAGHGCKRGRTRTVPRAEARRPRSRMISTTKTTTHRRQRRLDRAEADRGLTDDDIAEQAREDAGIVPSPAHGRRDRRSGAAAPAAGSPRPPRRRPRDRADGSEEAAASPRRSRPQQGRRRRSRRPATALRPQAGARPRRQKVQYVDAGELGDVDVDGTCAARVARRRDARTPPRARAARAVPPAATSWSCTSGTTASRTSPCSKAAS